MTGHDVKAYFQAFYPETDAFEWDHVGLQVGDLNVPITKILLTLDVTLDVIHQAIKHGANMIVSHHPMLFHAVHTIDVSRAQGTMIEACMKAGITVYSAHTNYDVGEPGMNGVMARMLGLGDIRVLNPDAPGKGIGRVGEIEPTALSQFTEHIKTVFNVPHVRLITDESLKTPITRVALSGGAGSEDMGAALAQKADLFLTGDIKHHTALDLLAHHLSAVDIGHFAEHVFKEDMKNAFTERGFNVMVSDETFPFTVF